MIDKIKKLIASTNIEDIQLGMILFSRTSEYKKLLKSKEDQVSFEEYTISAKMMDEPCGVAFAKGSLWIDTEHLIYSSDRERIASYDEEERKIYNFLIYEEEG